MHTLLKAFSDGAIFGDQVGDAPRIVALHGWARDHSDFAETLDGLDHVAIDLPGFGRSPAPPAPWGAADYAEAIAAAIGHLRAPLLVVGHSFGGRVAVHLAAEHPKMISALVLTGVPLLHRAGRRSTPPWRFRTARRLHAWHLIGDARMETLRNRYGSADYRATSGVMREVFVKVVNESYEEQIEATRCPVELVWGDSDDQVPPEVATRAEALFADARLTLSGGVGHLLPIEAPAVLRAAIERQRKVGV